MLHQRTKRKERLKSTSSTCSNGHYEDFDESHPFDLDPTSAKNGLGRRKSSGLHHRPQASLPTTTLLLLVLLLSVAVAILLTMYLSEVYSKSPGHARATVGDKDALPGLLPDVHHLNLVEENDDVIYKKTQVVQSSDFSLPTDGDDAEALQALSGALNLMAKNHMDKARKVFEHAMALSPNNPKILNRYGEFIEEQDQDALRADFMYTKALIYSNFGSEEHNRALENRRRTSAMVDEIDSNYLSDIDDKKKQLQRISDKNPAFRRAKKEAYYQHIHHTVAIEGNTMSLHQTRSILETKLAVGGKSIIEHNEVLGLDAALKYINQTLVDRVTGDIRMEDILEIHRRVIGYTDPTEAGMFRRNQVFVGDHIPPKAAQIQQLMDRFMTWLNSPEALMMHPVKLAALAHYKLVYIHPFVDGNGRTSRLLMNLILMQHGFPPVIIRKQDRLQYYQFLVTANAGDVRPFVRFIAKSTERTLNAYLIASSEHSLVPFNTDDVETIPRQQSESELAYHDQVIMGGEVGPLQHSEPSIS